MKYTTICLALTLVDCSPIVIQKRKNDTMIKPSTEVVVPTQVTTSLPASSPPNHEYKDDDIGAILQAISQSTHHTQSSNVGIPTLSNNAQQIEVIVLDNPGNYDGQNSYTHGNRYNQHIISNDRQQNKQPGIEVFEINLDENLNPIFNNGTSYLNSNNFQDNRQQPVTYPQYSNVHQYPHQQQNSYYQPNRPSPHNQQNIFYQQNPYNQDTPHNQQNINYHQQNPYNPEIPHNQQNNYYQQNPYYQPNINSRPQSSSFQQYPNQQKPSSDIVSGVVDFIGKVIG